MGKDYSYFNVMHTLDVIPEYFDMMPKVYIRIETHRATERDAALLQNMFFAASEAYKKTIAGRLRERNEKRKKGV